MKMTFATMAVAMALSATAVHAQPAPQATAAARLPDSFASPDAAPPANSSAPSQIALREAILSIQGNEIDYTLFSDNLGSQIRDQADQFGSLLNQFGPLQSVTYKATQDGAQLFDVQFEKQKTEWMIGLDDDGRVAVLLFRPAQD